MPYFLMTKDPCIWKVDIEKFTRQLRATWTNVEIWNVNIPPDTISWSFEIGDDKPFVDLLPEHETITIESSEIALAKFSIWYRKIVPEECDLDFFHESWGEEGVESGFEITRTMTEAELLEKLSTIG